jgi:transposase-like protein
MEHVVLGGEDIIWTNVLNVQNIELVLPDQSRLKILRSGVYRVTLVLHITDLIAGPMKPRRDTNHEADKLVRDIQRATRRQFSGEEEIRIVLAGLRGEGRIAECCRREGIHQNWSDRWSKEFLEAGKSAWRGIRNASLSRPRRSTNGGRPISATSRSPGEAGMASRP